MYVSRASSTQTTFEARWEGHVVTVWSRIPCAVGEPALVELDRDGYPIRVAMVAWESSGRDSKIERSRA
jgi:hypothetical protein